MLESIPTRSEQVEVFRLASYRGDEEFLQEEGADTERVSDMMKLLASTGATDSLEELCDDPFKPKRRLYGTTQRPASRMVRSPYSTALWRPERQKPRFGTGFPRGLPVSRLTGGLPCTRASQCDFHGSVKDLRPMQTE